MRAASLLLGMAMSVTASYTTVTITSSASFSDTSAKFVAGCAVGTKVVMIPKACDKLLIFDTSDNSQSLVTITGVSTNACFWSCATIGNKVYMPPRTGHTKVGIYDSSSGTFSTVNTGITLTNNYHYYEGATAIGTKVYFSPNKPDNIGRTF